MKKAILLFSAIIAFALSAWAEDTTDVFRNNRFIIGDVMENSINEIWNSNKAKSLYFIKQSDIPEDSLCHTCSMFKECRSLKQVCYREIIKKYGSDKWYYPDVNCPFSKDAKN